MQVLEAGQNKYLLLELDPEFVGNIARQAGFEFKIDDRGRVMSLDLSANDRQAPLLLFDAADPAHTVSQKGRAFHPTEVTINRDETLTFTNEDSFIHQIYVDGLFDSEEKGPGEVLNETFSRTGTFQVRCHIHPIMRLIVHVK